MPAAVIPFPSQLQAEFAVLSVAPPGEAPIPFGILLIQGGPEELQWKFRDDLDDLPLSPEDIEYLKCLDSDFESQVKQTGSDEFVQFLEDSLSGFLRLSDREAVSGRTAQRMLDRLFDDYIDTAIRQYRTHLPLYGLRAAATRFGKDSEVSETDVEWVRVPGGLRVSPDMFVVQVVGRSMEPLIPDGSRVIFRRIGVGSRQGKRILIEELGATDSSARFSVKRYTSAHVETGEDEWHHDYIRLEPLNPEFPAFELDPEAFEGRYRVIGEFVQVLPPEDED